MTEQTYPLQDPLLDSQSPEELSLNSEFLTDNTPERNRLYETPCESPIIQLGAQNKTTEKPCGQCEQCIDDKASTLWHINQYQKYLTGNTPHYAFLQRFSKNEDTKREALLLYKRLETSAQTLKIPFRYLQIEQRDISINQVITIVYGIPFTKIKYVQEHTDNLSIITPHYPDFRRMAKCDVIVRFNQDLKKSDFNLQTNELQFLQNSKQPFYYWQHKTMYMLLPSFVRKNIFTKDQFRAINKNIVEKNITWRKKNSNSRFRTSYINLM